jgi:hypothetical protein
MPRSKNVWSYTATPQYAFLEWCLVKKLNSSSYFQCVTRTSLITSLILIHIFSKSYLFETLGRLGSEVGLLLTFSSLKYGFDIRKIVFSRFWPFRLTEVSALGTDVLSFTLKCDRFDSFCASNSHCFCITSRCLFNLITWTSFVLWGTKFINTAPELRNIFHIVISFSCQATWTGSV